MGTLLVGPTKVYKPPRIRFAALRLVLPGVALAVVVYLLTDLLMLPAAVFVACVALGGGAYIDVFAGRMWVLLYEDHLELQGPLSNALEAWAGLRVGKTRIGYRQITALGRSELEGKGSFLVIHRKTGWVGRKFFVPCEEYQQVQDLKNELLRRIPAGCTLYTWKGFGRRGPFK